MIAPVWIDGAWVPSEFAPKRPMENRLLELKELDFARFLGGYDRTHLLVHLVKVGHDAALLVEGRKGEE